MSEPTTVYLQTKINLPGLRSSCNASRRRLQSFNVFSSIDQFNPLPLAYFLRCR